MRNLIRLVVSLAAIGAAIAGITAQNAQAPPPAKGAESTSPTIYKPPPAIYRLELPPDVAAARRDQENARTCALPGTTDRFKVNQTVTHAGQAYRCVETFTPDDGARGAASRLLSNGVAWIKINGK